MLIPNQSLRTWKMRERTATEKFHQSAQDQGDKGDGVNKNKSIAN